MSFILYRDGASFSLTHSHDKILLNSGLRRNEDSLDLPRYRCLTKGRHAIVQSTRHPQQ